MRSLLLILIISSVCMACERSAPDNANTTSANEPATTANNSASSNTSQIVANTNTENEALPTPPTGTIEFDNPWIRMVPNVSPNSAAYLSISNSTEEIVTLTSISSQVAERIEIHNVTVDDAGTMSMFEIDSLQIDPKSVMALEPSGAHIMIFGLKEPLNQGEMVTMMLSFDDQPPIPVNFSVK